MTLRNVFFTCTAISRTGLGRQ